VEGFGQSVRPTRSRLAKEVTVSGLASVLARRTRAAALPLLVLATTAGAQRNPTPQLARAAPVDVTAPSTILAADSAARHQRVARTQRLTGGALMTVGLATVAGAYVHFARAGRMGMTGAQAATFAAGSGLGIVGATRWRASRETRTTAARPTLARTDAQR
jgi:hypothetical protein